MKKILQITLGIITSIGGFLEIGSVVTAAQAGAGFGYKLLWAILLGTICLVFLVEMSGRLAAVSKHTIVDATRARFGFPFDRDGACGADDYNSYDQTCNCRLLHSSVRIIDTDKSPSGFVYQT